MSVFERPFTYHPSDAAGAVIGLSRFSYSCAAGCRLRWRLDNQISEISSLREPIRVLKDTTLTILQTCTWHC